MNRCAKKNSKDPTPVHLSSLSRRDFLKTAALSIGGVIVGRSKPISSILNDFNRVDFPASDRLGRVAVGMVELKQRPDPDSKTLGVLYEDTVVPWLGEVSGENFAYIFNNQRWVETPDGFIYGPYLQPVRNQLNKPVSNLPPSSRGAGMWVEVTVPFADAQLDKAEPSSNSWAEVKMKKGMPLRAYYSQAFWVDQIRTLDDGTKQYRVNPNFYGGVDMFWAEATAFRPITNEDITPISPEVTDKMILVDLAHQTLACYEGKSEVYFCRVSTGAKFDMYGNPVDKWATPVGLHRVTRKYISLQMSGGTTGAGYDLPGVAWVSIFATGGVAIHSTFWHNNYGDPVSNGCVNCTPEDANWIFRWTNPEVLYDPGMVDVTISGQSSTGVKVVEA